MVNWQNGLKRSENGDLNDMGLLTIDAGEGRISLNKDKTSLDRVWHRDIISHAKAVRRTAAYLQIGIGEREINALSILSSWCWINKKPGGAIAAIVNWSGANIGWKSKIRGGIYDCLKKGLIEKIPRSNGYRLCLTVKGERVLEVYDRFCDHLSGIHQND